MAQRDKDRADADGDNGRDGMEDIGDAAQAQMPGKPPNLTYDPSRRKERLEREAGERAIEEAEKEKAGR
jgi:hypothetical protein